jgi:hypothetical protein
VEGRSEISAVDCDVGEIEVLEVLRGGSQDELSPKGRESCAGQM